MTINNNPTSDKKMKPLLPAHHSKSERAVINLHDNKNEHQPTQIPTGKQARFYISGNLFICIHEPEGATKLRPNNLSNRQSISSFTLSSYYRCRRFIRSSVCRFTHAITLTYPHDVAPNDGRIFKQHLKVFCQRLFRESDSYSLCDKSTRCIAWVMEFTENGVPHFHLLTTDLFPGRADNKDLYRHIGIMWAASTKNEDHPKMAIAGTRYERLRGDDHANYFCKYATKPGDQKDIPPNIEHAGRFWGVVGCRYTVAATAVIDRNSAKIHMVNSTISLMRELLTDAVANKTAKPIRRDRSIIGYRLNSELLKSSLLHCINYLRARMIVASHAPPQVDDFDTFMDSIQDASYWYWDDESKNIFESII